MARLRNEIEAAEAELARKRAELAQWEAKAEAHGLNTEVLSLSPVGFCSPALRFSVWVLRAQESKNKGLSSSTKMKLQSVTSPVGTYVKRTLSPLLFTASVVFCVWQLSLLPALATAGAVRLREPMYPRARPFARALG